MLKHSLLGCLLLHQHLLRLWIWKSSHKHVIWTWCDTFCINGNMIWMTRINVNVIRGLQKCYSGDCLLIILMSGLNAGLVVEYFHRMVLLPFSLSNITSFFTLKLKLQNYQRGGIGVTLKNCQITQNAHFYIRSLWVKDLNSSPPLQRRHTHTDTDTCSIHILWNWKNTRGMEVERTYTCHKICRVAYFHLGCQHKDDTERLIKRLRWWKRADLCRLLSMWSLDDELNLEWMSGSLWHNDFDLLWTRSQEDCTLLW